MFGRSAPCTGHGSCRRLAPSASHRSRRCWLKAGGATRSASLVGEQSCGSGSHTRQVHAYQQEKPDESTEMCYSRFEPSTERETQWLDEAS